MPEKARVLIVDDQRKLREYLGFILKDKYAVATAGAAEDAFVHMAEHSVNVVLMDFNMPNMDGITALGEIKKNHPDTEIIMMTGYASPDIMRKAFKLGAFAFFSKPFNINELVGKIDEALRKSRPGAK